MLNLQHATLKIVLPNFIPNAPVDLMGLSGLFRVVACGKMLG